MRGFIFDQAVAWRISRINALRLALWATAPQMVSRRLRLELDLEYERAQLAELLRAGSERSAPPEAA